MTYPQGYVPLNPDVDRLLWQQIAYTSPSFTLISTNDDPPVEISKGIWQQWFHYVLEPWETGEQLLSFGLVTFKNNQGRIMQVLSNTISVQVTAPKQIVLEPAKPMVVSREPQLELDAYNQQLQAENNLRQPALYRHIDAAHTFPWHYLVGYFALATLATAGLLLYRQAKASKTIAAPPPSARATALTKLARLKQQTPQTPEEHEFFFIDLSNIIRGYLEKATGINAPEQTTPEFLAALANNPALQPHERDLISDLLSQADLVKFAAQETTAERCHAALQAARQIINSSGGQTLNQNF